MGVYVDKNSLVFPWVKFEIDWKFGSHKFVEPGFLRSFEMSASFNVDEYVAWIGDEFASFEMNVSFNVDEYVAWIGDEFARCEIRIEKVYLRMIFLEKLGC